MINPNPPSDIEIQDWEEYVKNVWGEHSFMAEMHQRLCAEIRRLRKLLEEK